MPLFTDSKPSIGESAMEQVMVTMKVGADEQAFMVHKGLLCSVSPYLNNALTGPGVDGEQSVIELPETDPEIFESYILDWFYRGTLPKQPSLMLVEVYIFADRYDIPTLRDHVVRVFFAAYVWNEPTKLPGNRVVIKAFNDLPESSTLCKLFLDMYASRWNSKNDTKLDVELREQLPREFIMSLMVELGRREPSNEKMEQMGYYQEDPTNAEE